MKRAVIAQYLVLLSISGGLCVQSSAQSTPQPIVIDADAPGTGFPHFWEQMFGSGRLALAFARRIAATFMK